VTTNVHIERLIVHDANAGDAQAIGLGLKRELTRLLREGGLSEEFQMSAAVPELRVGGIDIGTEHGPTIGKRIATALYRGIGD
jgi:hypothetical protein